ncbi:hypothetical protein [uncultured Clostridium sp.]|uniref:hypothetical protein n=1 Tax=uncultured Clostridium sp. TaxID=59620 RepID=UPI0028EBD823|nr:hypothetical protein [uncultured Clostridium sp.]
MGWNIKAAENLAKGAVNSFKKESNKFIENTSNDINNYVNHTLNCLADIDQIRIRAMERFIQYETGYVGALIEAGIIPAKLVRMIQDQIFGTVKYDPPVMYRLAHPSCVWTGAPPELVPFDIRTEKPRKGVKPFIFVHGMLYNQSKTSAYGFYKPFEKSVKMYRDKTSDNDTDDVDIYILSYDSNITDETNLIIRRAIEAEIGTTVTGQSTLIFLAILWRDLVERAREAGEIHLLPFFREIVRQDDRGSKSGIIVSHSLGNEAVAFAAQELSYGPICDSWWCMAAALPADSFTNTGSYSHAPLISGTNDGSTIVWFSRTDATLSSLYPLGNTAPNGEPMLALGVTGALQHEYPLSNLDVSLCTDITHEVRQGYFSKLSKNMRCRLGLEPWPELLCELSIPNRRD